MARDYLVGALIFLVCIVCCGACCPEFTEVRCSAEPAQSGRAFVANCGEEIQIRWQIANEGDIANHYVKLLYPRLEPQSLFEYDTKEPVKIEPGKFKYEFTFDRPVTVQLTILCSDGVTKRTVWLDFITQDYYFHARLICDHELCNYPELGFGSFSEIDIDFIDFVAFYDAAISEARVIDYLKVHGTSPGPFAMRTDVPANEAVVWCADYDPSLPTHAGEICSKFSYKGGNGYAYAEVNAVVYGGAFAKTGRTIVVPSDKGGEVETREGNTEQTNPIFCAVQLSDLGEWVGGGTSEPPIIDIQLGNKSQGLALITDDRFLPAGVDVLTTIGSDQDATVRSSGETPTIEGTLKGAIVGFSINTEDGTWIAAPVIVGIQDASWYMPYLPDTANLRSVCGQ